MNTFLTLLVNALSMGGMGTAVVMESRAFPFNQWLLVTCYTLSFALLFLGTLTIVYRVPLVEIGGELKQWRQYCAIGMFWSMNYVFILLSAPYLPNTIQVVLAQLQCVLVAFIDFKYLGVKLGRQKRICILMTVVFGLSGVAFSAESSSESTIVTLFWSAVFLVNSFAGGFAQLCTEALLKLKKDNTQGRLMQVDEAPKTALDGKYDTTKQVVMLNFCANCYGVGFCLLGIPIALFSLRYPNHDSAEHGSQDAGQLVNFTIFADVRILYWLLMLVSSFVYTIVQGCLATDVSAIYGIMASSFGAFLQLLFFLIPSLPEEFRQTFSLPAFLLSLAVTLCAAVYTYSIDKQDPEALKASIIGKYFTAAMTGEPQTNAVIFSGIVVYIICYLAMGGLCFFWAAPQ